MLHVRHSRVSTEEGPPNDNLRKAHVAQERDFRQHLHSRRYVKYFDRQVLKYDTEGITGPGVFRAIFTSASVFGSWQLLRDVLLVASIALMTLCMLLFTGTKVTKIHAHKLKTLVTQSHLLCTFLLGFLCSTSIARWWAIRNDCLGALWGAMNDLSLLIGSHFASDTLADREVRERVLRWSVLSHELIYKQARAETSFQDLVTSGLLLPHELELLEPLTSKPQVVWAWMCSYFAHLAYGDPDQGGSRLPFPMTVLPQLHEICRHARGAIGTAFAYTDTQLPFCFVHFLSLVVWMHNLTQAVYSGMVVAWELDSGEDANIAMEAMFPFFYPLIFFGLKNLCVGMLNPLHASRDVDFPRGAFTYYMLAENRSLYAGNIRTKGPSY